MADETKISNNNVLEINFKLEVELPVFNKVFFCVPMRPGLIAWSLLQLVATLVILGYAVSSGFDSLFSVIIMIHYILDVICCLVLLKGIIKEKGDIIKVSYHLLVYKMWAYMLFFMMSYLYLLMDHDFERRFYNNTDTWTYFIVVENAALGCIIYVLQFYLFLLVRSALIKLNHPINDDNDDHKIEKDSNSPDSTKLTLYHDKEVTHKQPFSIGATLLRFSNYLDHVFNDKEPLIKEDPKLSIKIALDHDVDGTDNVSPESKDLEATIMVVEHENNQAKEDNYLREDLKQSIKIPVDHDVDGTDNSLPKSKDPEATTIVVEHESDQAKKDYTEPVYKT